MDYLKYEETIDSFSGYTYLEIEDGYAVRQIFKSGNFYIASNRKHEEYEFWLAEGLINIDEFEGNMINIDASEFKAIWLEYSKKLQTEWCATKQTYTIGTNVYGNIEVFYPQGVIVSISDTVVAIADYNECKNSTTPDKLYPNHHIMAIVAGYDEVNMWLILGKSNVTD